MERPTKEQWERLTEEQQEQVTEWGKSRVWKPKYKEMYWFVRSDGNVTNTMWYGSKMDVYRYHTNEIYRTKEECEFAKERKLVIGQLERLAKESGKIGENKWYIEYANDIEMHAESIRAWYHTMDICFATEKSCEKAIETVGEDKIRKYC